MAVERVQASPFGWGWGGSPGHSISFGSDLTAGNDVVALANFAAADAPLDSMVLVVDGGSPVAGTLLHTGTRNMGGDEFAYAFYIWRDVPAGPATITATRSTGISLGGIEISPDSDLESTFSSGSDEGDFPVTTLQAGNLAYAGIRSEDSTGMTGVNGSLIQGSSGDWDYAISAEFANASGNALEWTKTTGTYRGIVGIVLAEAGGGGEQEITPPLVSRTKAIYAPAVVPGAVSITPGTVSRSKALFPPVVVPGSVAISPPVISRSRATIAPTVVPGQVGLTPPLLSRAKAIYPPTVSAADGELFPSLITRAKSVYAPIVVPGGVGLTPPLVSRSRAIYAPSVGAVLPLTDAEMRDLYNRVIALQAQLDQINRLTSLIPALL